MKHLRYIPLLILTLGFHSFAEENETVDSPELLVELQGFGFKSDARWRYFTPGMERAFAEAGIERTLKFERFPVREKEGQALISLNLVEWKVINTGERQIKFWADYLDEAGEEFDYGVIVGRDMAFDVSISQKERNLERVAFKACEKLVEKILKDI